MRKGFKSFLVDFGKFLAFYLAVEVLGLLGDSLVSVMFRTLAGNGLSPRVRAPEIKNEDFLSCDVLSMHPVVDSSGTPSLFIEVIVEK